MLSHPVRRDALDKAAIRHEGYNTLSLNAIRRPTESFNVGIAQAILKRCGRIRAVCISHTAIELVVFAVFIIVVLILLPSIVWRGFKHDQDRASLLPLHACGVLSVKGN